MEMAGVKWTDIAQLGVSIAGFGFVAYQILQLNKSVAGDSYTSLYEQYVEVGKIFLERPQLRPYFYDDRSVDVQAPGGEETLAQVEIVSELVTGLLEHAALQRKSMDKGIYEQCWEAYTKERFHKSPALRKFWAENTNWYADKFKPIAESCIKSYKPGKPPGSSA